MTRRRILGMAALVAAIGGACNFETSFRFDTHVDPGPLPGDLFRDACQDQAIGSCSYEKRCRPLLFERLWADVATCQERETLGCQLEAADPSSTYDDASIRSCTLPADLPCPSEPGYDPASAAFRATCERPPGELSDGAACAWHSACASGVCLPDYSAPEGSCGTCVPPPCGGGCAPGQACLISALDSKCLGAVGDPCTVAFDCATYRCENAVCAARSGIGEACDPGDDDCVLSYCDHATKVCSPFVVAQANEPCGLHTICAGGGACPFTVSSPTCIPPAEDGALCDPSQSSRCLFPARCIDGFCRFPQACLPPS